MRDISLWKKKLISDLKSVFHSELSLSRFLDIELGLFLWEMISPEGSSENVWVLLTGYEFQIPSFQALDTRQKTAIATARYYLRYYKSKQLWKDYIRRYMKIDQSYRLYDIDPVNYRLMKRTPSICSRREEIYEEALSKCPQHIKDPIKSVETNRVYFMNDKECESVCIPDSWKYLSKEERRITFSDNRVRNPLMVSVFANEKCQ